MDIRNAIMELLNIKKFNYTLAPDEVFDTAIAALLKQEEVNVRDVHVDEYYCPTCGAENNCDQGVVHDNYCPNCGQKFNKTSIS